MSNVTVEDKINIMKSFKVGDAIKLDWSHTNDEKRSELYGNNYLIVESARNCRWDKQSYRCCQNCRGEIKFKGHDFACFGVTYTEVVYPFVDIKPVCLITEELERIIKEL